MKVYIAGPLFCTFEREFLERVEGRCKAAGWETFLPHRDAGLVLQEDMSRDEEREVFRKDSVGVDDVDVVVAVISGPDVDAGTAWELGYAFARGKKCFGLMVDDRLNVLLNPMLAYSCQLVYSLEELEKELKKVQ